MLILMTKKCPKHDSRAFLDISRIYPSLSTQLNNVMSTIYLTTLNMVFSVTMVTFWMTLLMKK